MHRRSTPGLACLLALAACEQPPPAVDGCPAASPTCSPQDPPATSPLDQRRDACPAASPTCAPQDPPATSPVDQRRDACLAANPAQGRYRGLVNAFCSEHANLGGIGASLAVAEHGRLTFTATAGQRCRDGAPVTTATAFRLGSLTKLATAALALTFVDEHRLDLDAPLRLDERRGPQPPRSPPTAVDRTAWPAFTDPRAAAITPRQLLNHTAALGDLDPRELTAPWLATLAARPLAGDPGHLWNYSNAGYALLGALLERRSDTSYPRLLADRLLTPLRLEHTTADLERALAGDTACGHLGRGPDARPLDVRQDLEFGAAGATWTIPAGGLLASPADLVALVLGLLDPARSPLGPAARAALLAADTPTHERPGERYALGVRMQPLADGAPLYRHSGHTGDFAADLSFAPDRGFVLALLTNTGDPLRATLAAAHHDLLGEPPAPPAPALSFDHYAGTYVLPDASAILVEAGTLTAPALALDRALLEHLGDHRFRTRSDPPRHLTFIFLEGTSATHLRTRDFIAPRIP